MIPCLVDYWTRWIVDRHHPCLCQWPRSDRPSPLSTPLTLKAAATSNAADIDDAPYGRPDGAQSRRHGDPAPAAGKLSTSFGPENRHSSTATFRFPRRRLDRRPLQDEDHRPCHRLRIGELMNWRLRERRLPASADVRRPLRWASLGASVCDHLPSPTSWGGRPALCRAAPLPSQLPQRWRPQYARKLPCRSAAVISANGMVRPC
jgi:hypothetical protein